MVSICWIGNVLYFDKNNYHADYKKNIGFEEPNSYTGKDGSVYHQWFALTVDNYPIGLLEHADEIAEQKSTHVISFHDY